MDVAAHAPQAASPRRTHPIVALDYRVRTWANLLVAIVMLSVFLERGAAPWVWALVVFQGLLWAPLARQLACRADDSRAAEHRNLMADAVLYGVLSGLVAFQLWPTTMMLTAILLSILSLGGLKLAARAGITWAAGAMLGAAMNGFAFQFESSLRTSLMCVACFVPYLLMFGMSSYEQTRQAQRARHEVSQRNEQITQKNRKLELACMLAESASRTKGAFLANMSHELRTPLNAIIGYTELLESEMADAGDCRWADDLQKIRIASAKLLAMIEDVLNLSKMEAGQMNVSYAPFDPAELVQDVARDMREEIERNGNAFRLRSELSPLRLLSDAGKIRQILEHLLSNAGKFTRAGEVVLTARHDHASQMLVLQVDDTGIGITAAQRDALFRAFSQVDTSTTRRFDGSGLGLAITHYYCELMGGSIEVKSKAGAGSHFVARLPAPVAANRSLAHA